jgi:hypothetical protein
VFKILPLHCTYMQQDIQHGNTRRSSNTPVFGNLHSLGPSVYTTTDVTTYVSIYLIQFFRFSICFAQTRDVVKNNHSF